MVFKTISDINNYSKAVPDIVKFEIDPIKVDRLVDLFRGRTRKIEEREVESLARSDPIVAAYPRDRRGRFHAQVVFQIDIRPWAQSRIQPSGRAAIGDENADRKAGPLTSFLRVRRHRQRLNAYADDEERHA